MRIQALLPIFLLTACGGGDGNDEPLNGPVVTTPPAATLPPPAPAPAAGPPSVPALSFSGNLAANVNAWSVGPVIGGYNYSPAASIVSAPGGFAVNIPSNPSKEAGAPSAGYVTMQYGRLDNAKGLTFTFKFSADPGVTLHPKNWPRDMPALVTLYFQKSHDIWRNDGYRWWGTPKTVERPEIGKEYTVTHMFDEKWTSVLTMDSQNYRSVFDDARMYALNVGFTLGGGDGYGHGIWATGPAQLVVTDFRIIY